MKSECDSNHKIHLSWHTLFIVFVLATFLNLWFLYLYYSPVPKRLHGDENYYFGIAKSIAEGNPITHSTIWPSFYGSLMGKLFTIAGPHIIYIQIIQIVMWLITALLFYRIILHLFQYKIIAYTALLLFLLSPELISFCHFLWPEIPHLFFFFTALWLAVCHFNNPCAVIFCGVFFGLALLTKLLLLPFIPIILVFLIFCTPGEWKQKFFKTFAIGSIAFIMILPTMLNNLHSKGKFMIADSSLVNIWIGLNDVGPDTYKNRISGTELLVYEQTGGDIVTRNRLYREKIIQKIHQEGIFHTLIKQLSKQYFRLFSAETYFTAQLPGRPLHAYSFTSPFLRRLLRGYSHLLYGLVLALSTISIFFIRSRPIGWPHIFLLFILYNLVLYFFLHAKPRYVIQFIPMMMFFAGVTMQWITQFVRGEPMVQLSYFKFSRPRIVFGLVFVALVELIAFRGALVNLLE